MWEMTPRSPTILRLHLCGSATGDATGGNSADGHQWSTTAFSTDYMEKSFAGFARSYPDGFGGDDNDALAYSPAGFIWDSVLKHKKLFRNYGEFTSPGSPHFRWRDSTRRATPKPIECYLAWKNQTGDIVFDFDPSVETIRPYSPRTFPGWEMSVPDQFRADFFLNELRDLEKKGEFPNLVILCLFNDHTEGTKPGYPTPRACVADNDRALGRVVEGLSRSKFWKQMAIFCIEDDPQDGWDHVSGYRTVAFCASPYAKRGAVISTQYNTTSILRTIEQILGLPPMNQFDLVASPMRTAFVPGTPSAENFQPWTHVANEVPLDQGVTTTTASVAKEPLSPAAKALKVAWLEKKKQIFAGKLTKPDAEDPEAVNHLNWYMATGFTRPYPGETKVRPPSEFKKPAPAGDLDD